MARPARSLSRQASVAGLLLGSLACANVGDPPGGPPDVAPPRIVSVRPESGAVVPNWKDDAVIQFDEVIEEMPGTGPANLAAYVLLSPTARGMKVSWHRSSISVKPREGWKHGGARVYRLEILPGILDLRRNRLDSATIVLFSTGPEIGHARIGGIALAWVEQRVLPRALIEAVPLPDSIGYLTLADSGGQFNLEGLTPGRYIVYATADENGDRRRGLREPYDSTLVTLDSSSNVALYTFLHDTVPPRLRVATAIDSLSARVEFTQPLDATIPLDTTQVRVLELPDSTPVAIASILTQRQYDSLTAAAARAKADSAAAQDTAAGRQRVAPPPGPEQPGQPRRPALQVDTSLVRQLLAERPVPSDRIVLTFARALKPETRYLIRVTGATNLTGRKGDGQVVLLVPKPAVADTTRRRPDSLAPSPKPQE
ncbi:MAG: Ig-like domain-containing protein [Gemmatimonadales bacterium]